MSEELDSNAIRLPYPGLRPFLSHEAPIFFGRGDQIGSMLDSLEQNRFVAVIGASGSGKSSLVRAGLVPTVEQGFLGGVDTKWATITFRPGEQPFHNLAVGLQRVLSPTDASTEKARSGVEETPFVEAVLRSGPRGISELIEDARFPADKRILLVVDQFEEVFRFRERYRSSGSRNASRSEATSFVRALLNAAESSDPIYVVLTMRSDFVGDCDVFHGLPEAINRSQFLTPRMTRSQLRDAIVEPARAFGGSFENSLVDRFLNDAGDDPDHLPLMQHALMRTWQTAKERSGRSGSEIVMTSKDYDHVGGARGTLSQHADVVLKKQGSERANVVRALFTSLSERTPDGRLVRRIAKIQEIADVARVPTTGVAQVVEAFAAEGRSFVMVDTDGALLPTSSVDISHEALMRQWTTLNGWLEEERASIHMFQRLADQAKRWEKDGHSRARLWTGPNLEEARSWKSERLPTTAWGKRYGGGLEQAMNFLDASVHEDAQMERRRKRTKIAALFAVAGIIASISIALVENIRKRTGIEAANEQLDTANKQLDTANKQLESVNDQLNTANRQLNRTNKFLVDSVGELELAQSQLTRNANELEEKDRLLQAANEQLATASENAKTQLLTLLAKNDPTIESELQRIVDSLNTAPQKTATIPNFDAFVGAMTREIQVDLSRYFTDQEDRDQLTYAVELSNTAYLQFELMDETLHLEYSDTARGTSRVIVRAEDTGGKVS